MKRTKIVPELFAAGDFMFNIVLLGSKDNNSFVSYNIKARTITIPTM
jgi:hypothetical protein